MPGPIYTLERREALTVRVNCLALEHKAVSWQPELKPGPLINPETGTLTMKPRQLIVSGRSGYINMSPIMSWTGDTMYLPITVPFPLCAGKLLIKTIIQILGAGIML